MLWLRQGEQHKKIERLFKALFASTCKNGKGSR